MFIGHCGQGLGEIRSDTRDKTSTLLKLTSLTSDLEQPKKSCQLEK